MSKKKWIVFISAIAILAIMGLCIYKIIIQFTYRTFVGNRIGNPEKYILDFSYMNIDDSDTMVLNEGDNLHVNWAISKGTVNVLIVKEDGSEIYKGNKIDTADFVLPITEAGKYTVNVAAKSAVGNMKFIVE